MTHLHRTAYKAFGWRRPGSGATLKHESGYGVGLRGDGLWGCWDSHGIAFKSPDGPPIAFLTRWEARAHVDRLLVSV